jgi:hypothetical protein
MKTLRYVLLGVVLFFCVTVALANRAPVTLALWPDTMSAFLGFGYSITLPLFVIVSGALGMGLVLGLMWEWLRERSLRSDGAKARKELDKMRAVGAVPEPAPRPGTTQRDQVLAILDDSTPAQ